MIVMEPQGPILLGGTRPVHALQAAALHLWQGVKGFGLGFRV